ncbi:hypothetical protein, partial [Streptococcus pneumoniae]|uniref:hypothetical protein n=1 Tax=Streptococcus pneumoniae TaxID=1313 RepID=UPI0018B0EA6A
ATLRRDFGEAGLQLSIARSGNIEDLARLNRAVNYYVLGGSVTDERSAGDGVHLVCVVQGAHGHGVMDGPMLVGDMAIFHRAGVH